MVKFIKFGTWKTSKFDSAFLAKLVFAYLGQNRITHYQSSAFLPCVSFFNFISNRLQRSLHVVLLQLLILYPSITSPLPHITSAVLLMAHFHFGLLFPVFCTTDLWLSSLCRHYFSCDTCKYFVIYRFHSCPWHFFKYFIWHVTNSL